MKKYNIFLIFLVILVIGISLAIALPKVPKGKGCDLAGVEECIFNSLCPGLQGKIEGLEEMTSSNVVEKTYDIIAWAEAKLAQCEYLANNCGETTESLYGTADARELCGAELEYPTIPDIEIPNAFISVDEYFCVVEDYATFSATISLHSADFPVGKTNVATVQLRLLDLVGNEITTALQPFDSLYIEDTDSYQFWFETENSITKCPAILELSGETIHGIQFSAEAPAHVTKMAKIKPIPSKFIPFNDSSISCFPAISTFPPPPILPTPPPAPPIYTFVKEGLEELSQKHKGEWGTGYCTPTSLGISLGWFAEVQGATGLIPDTNGNGKVDEEEKYEAIDTIGKDYLYTDPVVGSGTATTLIGILRYLQDKNKNYALKHYYAADYLAHLENIYKQYKGKEKQIQKTIDELNDRIKKKEEEVKKTEEEYLKLNDEMGDLIEKRDETNDPKEKEKLTKEISDIIDKKYVLSDKITQLKQEIKELKGDIRDWKGILDLVADWPSIKDNMEVKGAPSFDAFSTELKDGEDVIVGIDTGGGVNHAMVGKAFNSQQNNDGSYDVAFVDPSSASTLDTKIRMENNEWYILVNGEWAKLKEMLVVSPKKP